MSFLYLDYTAYKTAVLKITNVVIYIHNDNYNEQVTISD